MSEIVLLASAACGTNVNCPSVFRLASGDFAVVGVEASPELQGQLPEGSGVGDGERLVIVPKDLLVDAGWMIPDS
ncbi:hypothetical protein [Streptomyces olivochromogenes]|uniref:hypothetical protein n=1 Tax=Streptomyces olivochromogenes TaxID=1963 RepID=UPI0010581FB6